MVGKETPTAVLRHKKKRQAIGRHERSILKSKSRGMYNAPQEQTNKTQAQKHEMQTGKFGQK